MGRIAGNIAEIRSALPAGVSLVAVSKFHPVEAIREAYDAGQRIFGENRVQELAGKQPLLPSDIEWHLTGTLQTNKVRHIAPFVAMIESVDSLRLLEEINRQALRYKRVIRVLLEVHIAEEANKRGLAAEECRELLVGGTLCRYTGVQVCGLMGMATFTDDTEQVRREFASLRALFDDIRSLPTIDCSVFANLSMGMSDDYTIAVEEGSNMVRIGRSIFK
ncbi:MAG: YggS family pyridoxal phosphate-dependent enzyme [Tannerella sp.]|jgi:pyridoxal phosphate enzyme (YggS family)|nr:YggS family pyridoxal phosphate-dependent enzyme [Tannerella sp.]